MTSNTLAKGLVKAVAILCGVALLLYFLYLIKAVLIYLAIAVVLTIVGAPIVSFLKRRLKFRPLLAVGFTLFVYLLVIGGFVMMFVPLVVAQGAKLSLLNTQAIEESIRALLAQIEAFLANYDVDSAKLLRESDFVNSINLNFIPNFFNILLDTLSSFGIGLASVLFITFFFLKDRSRLINGFKGVLPASQKDRLVNSFRKINVLLSQYLIGLLVQLSVIFMLYLIVLLIFGVDNAFVIAFLCAVLNIIPYIGPLIAAVFAAFLTMMSNIGSDFQSEVLPTTIYVLIGFWVVQLIDNNLTGPLIFSNSVKSHPLEIFLVILAAGFIGGIFAMVIAVPLYTIIKVVAKEFWPQAPVVKALTRDI